MSKFRGGVVKVLNENSHSFYNQLTVYNWAYFKLSTNISVNVLNSETSLILPNNKPTTLEYVRNPYYLVILRLLLLI